MHRVISFSFPSFGLGSPILSNYLGSWVMVLNATFNNLSVISWRSVVMMEETEGPGENQNV